MQNAFAHLKTAGAKFEEKWKCLDSTGVQLTPENRRALNAMFRQFERALTIQGGLPGRPWYVHGIYAPGQYTGYGVKTLPGIRESIELRNWKLAEEQIVVAARVFENASRSIGGGLH